MASGALPHQGSGGEQIVERARDIRRGRGFVDLERRRQSARDRVPAIEPEPAFSQMKPAVAFSV
jgi:hypothetical protein